MTYLLCSLACLIGVLIGAVAFTKQLQLKIGEMAIRIHDLKIQRDSNQGTIRALKAIAEGRDKSISALNGVNTKLNMEIDLLKKEQIDLKIAWDRKLEEAKG